MSYILKLSESPSFVLIFFTVVIYYVLQKIAVNLSAHLTSFIHSDGVTPTGVKYVR